MARFTASINDQLKKQLDVFAEENDFNRSQALELMIRTFFEGKADTPQPSPPPEEAPAQLPATRPDQTRLDELEARLEMLQDQLRESSPVNSQREMVEMQSRLTQMERFLLLQHGYVEGLHDVVVSNVNAHLEVYSRSDIDQELYVPGIEPPAPDWTGSSSTTENG